MTDSEGIDQLYLLGYHHVSTGTTTASEEVLNKFTSPEESRAYRMGALDALGDTGKSPDMIRFSYKTS